jgi:hypothetical protein
MEAVRMNDNRYARQSFLGKDSEAKISRCTVGVVGLGGGGSHIVQQLAHIGFQKYFIYDDDFVENSNLNRLIGAKTIDTLASTSKLHIAKMMIYGLQPNAEVIGIPFKWQERAESLRNCQIVFGCIETYRERAELEITCRRYLIHYIDVGMDVHGTDKPVIGGQVVMSSPGNLCMRCMGFLTNEKLALEAARYGTAGSRPQVVWPNGVLASTAVGLAVDLVTNWTLRSRSHAFLLYDGNRAIIQDSYTVRNFEGTVCPHFHDHEVGDPIMQEL